MKRKTFCAIACAVFGPILAAPLQADSKDEITPAVSEPTESSIPISQEFDVEGSYESGAKLKQGSAEIGRADNTYGHFDYVVSPQVKEGILLRFGVDGERNSFGLPAQAPLPNTLQSVNAIIGADFAVNDQILLRAEVHPGLYSDFVRVTGSDIDAPVQLGGTYLWNKNFQIIFGVQLDLRSNIPFIGVPGFRWQFADKWVLSAIPPKPQLQYELNKFVTLYAGSEIIAGTYHLNDEFGTYHGHGPANIGNSQFNGSILDYDEIRLGVGFTWQFDPNVSLDVSGGYVPYREYDIHPDHIGYEINSTNFHNNLGAGGGYAEVGIKGSF